ncbi:MAG: hypothetical protein PVI71_08560 [Desulfobacterales bacterium]
MKTRNKLLIFLCIFVCILSINSCAGRGQARAIRSHVAAAYGAAKFDQIAEIHYTFNIKIDNKEISRTWIWEPQKNRVTLRGTLAQGGLIRYNRDILKELAPEQLKKIDAWYLNDQYWLTFPLHLAWDTNIKVTLDARQTGLPIGQGKARRLIVTYPPGAGNPHADVYELYIGDNDRIVQWVCHQEGAPKLTRMSTWEEHRKVGPLLISMDRRGPDENFRVWFTNVAVRLVGTNELIEAK